MSWTEKFPAPGAQSPKPTAPGPAFFPSKEMNAYNDWVRANRKHLLAQALDALTAKEAAGTALTSAELVAVVLGTMLLEGSLREMDASNPLSVLFG